MTGEHDRPHPLIAALLIGSRFPVVQNRYRSALILL